jgi:two-component sensor histidine kinase
MSLSIRFIIPLVLALAILLAALWTFHVEHRHHIGHIEVEAVANLKREMTRLQESLELFMRHTDEAQIQQVVTSLAVDPHLDLAVMADDMDRIIASTRRSLLGKSLEALIAESQLLADPAISGMLASDSLPAGGTIIFTADRSAIAGLYPITMGAGPEELRPRRTGRLIIKRSISAQEQESLTTARRQALRLCLVFALTLGLVGMLIDVWITSRIDRLVAATERVAAGDLGTLTAVTGKDELGRLGAAFDAMIVARQQAEEELTEHRNHLEELVLSRTQELAASLREKEVLLRELFHRVKNNLQVIISLLRLQSRDINDPATLAAFTESESRIRAMALIHETLYQTQDISRLNVHDYVLKLVKNLSQVYGGTKIIVDEASDVLLPVDQAVPLGLIINELVSNSLKHAYPDGSKGEIAISVADLDGARVQLSVGDNGIGIPAEIDPESAKTLGLMIVRSLVKDQLGGSMKVSREGGTMFTIIFTRKANGPAFRDAESP